MWKKLPSPKWLAFGTVVTAAVSGVAYDKYEQSQIRALYMDHAKRLSTQDGGTVAPNVNPRKLLVLVAPPPNDYLETSLLLWRRWVKPILYSNGLDYEVVTGSQQGEIRAQIAERVRKLRKELREKEAGQQNEHQERGRKSAEDSAVSKPKEEFDTRSVLGIFYHHKPEPVLMEDALTEPSLAGGVICIGRGALKEYINGVHEGMLGPLDPPQPEVEDVDSAAQDTKSLPVPEESSEPLASVEPVAVEDLPPSSAAAVTEPTPPEAVAAGMEKEDDVQDDSEKEEKAKVIPKPFILPSEYPEATFPQELSKDLIRDPKTGVPAFFQQPLLVIAVPNLSGFTTIPTRISRFYQKRFLCEQVSRATLAMVESKSRPFNSTDLDLAAYEELDWPKKWIETGKERGSEWVKPLKGDERVFSKLRVVEPSMVEPLERVPLLQTAKTAESSSEVAAERA